MSAKAEEFARQLLAKTLDGKLKWHFVPDPELETYRSDAGDGMFFSIKRLARGDDKFIIFELVEPERVVLVDREDNIPLVPLVGSPFPLRLSNSMLSGVPAEPFEASKLRRFRLYNDLFYAVRETAEGGDPSIEKAEQFLARLA